MYVHRKVYLSLMVEIYCLVEDRLRTNSNLFSVSHKKHLKIYLGSKMISFKNINWRYLYIKGVQPFSSSNKQLLKNINEISEKVRLKQSVADMKKLQNYLHESTVTKGLNMAINRTAKYDEEFRAFLKGYREKNKEFANILDLSHYAQDQSMGNKTQQLREEEIMMLEEFRKRKQAKQLRTDEGEEGEGSKKKESSTHSFDDYLNHQLGELYQNEDFMTLIMERDSTTLVTKLNRVNHFRYLVFMGNCNGVIGYGKGKGNDFETALIDAFRQCKKNLIALNLDHFQSLTAPIKTKYNGLELVIDPRFSMNAWGNPIMSTMLMLAGITHCQFKIDARNMSQYNMVYAFFRAMTALQTPKTLAEHCGEKIYHQSFAPWKYSVHNALLRP